ncbi:MAG: hypothetical protein ACLPTZ_07300 [Beijerinckiaceae bacterium]
MATTINTSKLAAALRQKFPGGAKGGGAKGVLRRLGLDENLLDDLRKPVASGNGNSGGESDGRLKELRHALSAAVEKAGLSNRIHSDVAAEILELLDRHAPYALDEDDPLASFKKLLRANGLSEDDVMKACDIAARARSARDQMPANALEGGAGGARSGVKVTRPQRRIAADEQRLDRKFGVARIIGERRDADHSSIATGPSRRQVDRTFKKYPGIELIGRV